MLWDPSLPPVELQHLLGERGQEVLAIHRERADVQHREVGRKLLEKRTAASVPNLKKEWGARERAMFLRHSFCSRVNHKVFLLPDEDQ